MINEILTLINADLKAMDEAEIDIFTNHRAKYANSKSIMDHYRDEIEEIESMLSDDVDDESGTELKKILNNMSQSIQNSKESGVINPIDNSGTFNDSIDTMITALDNNVPETVLPTANIDIQAMENAIPTAEVVPQPPVVENVIANQPTMEPTPNVVSPMAPEIAVIEGTQDIVPEVQQVIIEEAPQNEVITAPTPEPQIMDNTQNEIITTVTPDIVITADQPDQFSEMTPPIEIPTVEPMIQVPTVEMPTNMPIADTTQTTNA